MPVGQYMGQSGIIMVQLERAMPGASIVAYIAFGLLCWLFYHEVKKLQEDPKKVFSYYFGLAFLSFILFGSMSVFLVVLVAIACFGLMSRFQWSRAQTVPAAAGSLLKKYFPEEYGVRETMKAAERVIEAEEKAVAPEEAAFAKEEQEVETLEEFADVISAAEEDVSKKITETIFSEKYHEEKEQALIGALAGYGRSIEEVLSKMESMDVVDQAGRRHVLQLVQSMSQTCQQIVGNEKALNQDRFNLVNTLANDVEVMNVIIKRSKRLEKGIEQIESSLERNLGEWTIARVKDEISKKLAKLKDLERDAAAARKSKNADTAAAIEAQIAALKTIIEQHQNQLQTMNNLLAQIKFAMADVKTNLSNISSCISTLNNAEAKVKSHAAILTKFLSSFNDEIKKLESAAGLFVGAVSKLSEEGETAVAEEVPITATKGIGDIFTEVLNLQDISLNLHNKGTKPFIEDMISVLQSTAPLNALMKSLHSSFANISRAFISLQTAALTVISNIHKYDQTTFDRMQAGLKQASLKEENERNRIAIQALASLNQSLASVNTEINALSGAKQSTLTFEKQLLGEMTRALNAIVSKKAQIDATFQTQAKQAMCQMSQAQAELQKARA